MTDLRPAERAELAFIDLRSAIVEAALPPGTRLPEDVIAARYGVSRTLVRATLARLTSAGLVATGQAKSATVAHPSLEEAKATFEVRRCLEREAARLAARRIDADGIARLRAHTEQEAAAAARSDTQVSGRLGAEFHLLLGEVSGNALLGRYLAEVVWRCAHILSIHGHHHDQHRSLEEHRRIVDLLERRDEDGAEQVLDAHIAAVEGRALRDGDGSSDHDLVTVLSRYSERRAASGG